MGSSPISRTRTTTKPPGGWLWHISMSASAPVPVSAVGACSVRRDRCSDHQREGHDMEMHGCSPAELALAHAAADTLRRRVSGCVDPLR